MSPQGKSSVGIRIEPEKVATNRKAVSLLCLAADAFEYDNGLCVTENQLEFHTESSDRHAHAAEFTTAWPPNKAIIGNSFYPGMDLNGKNEEYGGPTFSAINSRCFHPGGVNVLLGDGSVRFIKSGIDGIVWRALGTIAGGEVLSKDAD